MDPVFGGALIYGGVSAANLAYQAWQNRRTESREDNAITRQVADLRRAGLSPLLATGNGAPASTLPAPQVDSSGIGQSLMAYLQKKSIDADINFKKAQTILLNAEHAESEERLRQMRLYGARDYNPLSTAAYMGYENKDKILGLAGDAVAKGKELYDSITGEPVKDYSKSEPAWMASGGMRNLKTIAEADFHPEAYSTLRNAFRSELGLDGQELKNALDYARSRRSVDRNASLNDIFESYAKKIGKWR